MKEPRSVIAHSPRILVVDDEEKMCLSLKELFENEGFRVDTALSVKSAFSLLQHDRFNLVICDVRMPEMGGISLLSKIGNEVPVIMITAYASIDTARRVFKLGACDYLTKPFKFDELLVMVRQYMLNRCLDKDETNKEFLLNPVTLSLKRLSSSPRNSARPIFPFL